MSRPTSPQDREAAARADLAEAEAEARRFSIEARRRLLRLAPALLIAFGLGCFIGALVGFAIGRDVYQPPAGIRGRG